VIYFNLSDKYKTVDITKEVGYLWAFKDDNGDVCIQELINISSETESALKEQVKEIFEEKIVILYLSYLFKVTFEPGDFSVGIWPSYVASMIVENGAPVTRSYHEEWESSKYLELLKAYALNSEQTLLNLGAPRTYVECMVNDPDFSRKEMNEIEISVSRHLDSIDHD